MSAVNTVTPTTPGLVPNAPSDQCVLFGSGGHLLSTGNYTFASPLSFECWANRNGTSHSNTGIMGAWDGSAHGAMLYLTTGNTLLFYTSSTSLSSGLSLSANTTYYIVATWDGTNRRIYINGSLQAGPTAGTAPETSPTAVLELGGYQNTGGLQFDLGSLDDVAVYNVALSAADVTAHWNAAQ